MCCWQVSEAHEPVSSHVAAIVLGNSILVAVTGKRTPLCDTFVEVYLTNTTDIGHNLQVRCGVACQGCCATQNLHAFIFILFVFRSNCRRRTIFCIIILNDSFSMSVAMESCYLPVQRLEVPEAVHSSLLHLHTGEVVLMVQTRHSLYHYYMRGTKFVFVREVSNILAHAPHQFVVIMSQCVYSVPSCIHQLLTSFFSQ